MLLLSCRIKPLSLQGFYALSAMDEERVGFAYAFVLPRGHGNDQDMLGVLWVSVNASVERESQLHYSTT